MNELTGTHVSWSALDCVILDMDGTLLDLHFDKQLWYELLPLKYAALHDLEREQARARVRQVIEAERGTLAWYCLDHWSDVFGVDMTALEAELEHLIKPRPGALEFLRWIGDRGLRLILATNAHPASLARKLAVTGIAPWFADIVSAHDLGAAKESREFWQTLQRQLVFEPARALFIDDNSQVRKAAREWGIGRVFGVASPDSRGARVTATDGVCIEAFTDLTHPAFHANRSSANTNS